MAELEAEALLLGIWKNVEDLEESLNLAELRVILDASRKQRHEDRKFMAAMKGIDLDEGQSNAAQEAFDRAKLKAEAALRGESLERATNRADSEMFGLDFEVEE